MIYLIDRAVVKITGTDSRKFLQGLITNDVEKLNNKSAIYAALQTPQGKYLFDFLLFENGDEILIDIEKSRTADFIKKLGVYKLRSDVAIVESDYKVYSDQSKGLVDPRNSLLGKRFISIENFDEDGNLENYDQMRLRLGIPESKDLIPDKSFIIQNNFEQLNAIDYNKGCYVGQEIVARVKYKGNVSRQIFKVKGEGELPEFGTPIMLGEKVAGEMRSHQGEVGLAQCLVESSLDEIYDAAGQKVKLKLPDYMK